MTTLAPKLFPELLEGVTCSKMGSHLSSHKNIGIATSRFTCCVLLALSWNTAGPLAKSGISEMDPPILGIPEMGQPKLEIPEMGLPGILELG